MAAPKEIIELVERFDRNIDSYLSGQYNETQLRREFVDPFFKALGWDVDNEKGYAEAYKDVIHEDAIYPWLKSRGPTETPSERRDYAGPWNLARVQKTMPIENPKCLRTVKS